jgi:hypothetical protein
MRFPLVHQVAILTTAAAVAIVLLAASGAWRIQALTGKLVEVTQVGVPAQRMQMQMDMMHDGLRAVAYGSVIAAITDDAAMRATSLEELKEFSASFNESLDSLAALPIDASIAKALTDLRPKLNAYLASVEAVVQLAADKRKDEALAKLPALQVAFKELETRNEELGDLIQAYCQAEGQAARDAQAVAMYWYLGASVVALAIAVSIAVVICRRLSRRVRLLDQGIRGFAAGDLRTRIHLAPGDELADIAASLDGMARNLAGLLRTISERAGQLHQSAQGLGDLGARLSAASTTTADQAGAIAGATRSMSEGARSIAQGMGEMQASITEVSRSAQEITQVAAGAVDMTRRAATGMQRLAGGRRRGEAHLVDRRADQPAGPECHHRSGPGR